MQPQMLAKLIFETAAHGQRMRDCGAIIMKCACKSWDEVDAFVDDVRYIVELCEVDTQLWCRTNGHTF